MKKIKIIYLLILMPFSGFSQEKINAQEKVNELDDIIITASRKKESIKEVTSSGTNVE
jgi:iron complex outermembrane receptor protein